MPSTGFLFFLLIPLINGAPMNTNDAMAYLQKFGYAAPARLTNGAAGESDTTEDRARAVFRMYQEMSGLKVTGELDEATQQAIARPRCGVSDISKSTVGEGPKWSKTNLTYSIKNANSGMSMNDTRWAINKAFTIFEAVTPLKFKELSSGQVDINVLFARGDHGDGLFYAFDGNGVTIGNKTSNVLAHAFDPPDGRVHFDADDNWMVMNPNYLNTTHHDFLSVAIHEIGHALGLEHSRDPNSVMYASYFPPIFPSGRYMEPKLDQAVISILHGLYGPGTAEKPIAGQFTLKSLHGTFLRARSTGLVDMAPQRSACEQWYIVAHGDKVALRPYCAPGKYLRANPDGRIDLADWAREAEMWTPIKRNDDSWSFQNVWGLLSADKNASVYTVNTMIDDWENFRLEEWTETKTETTPTEIAGCSDEDDDRTGSVNTHAYRESFAEYITPLMPVTIPIDEFGPGFRVSIVGTPPHNAHRFAFNLNTPSGIAFHFSPRFDEQCIVINSVRNNDWQRQLTFCDDSFSFKRGQEFTVDFHAVKGYIKVSVNGRCLTRFHEREPPIRNVRSITAHGDVHVQSIRIEFKSHT